MAYSHSRLRKTLALVRIMTGAVFVSVGFFKVNSLEFARAVFPGFLGNAIQGGAVEWLRPALEWILSYGAGRIGVMVGFVELFIGIAMILGLAVRPAALVGMLYTTCLFLATWNPVSATPSMSESAEHQFRNLFPIVVFLLLGVGHAGETWGLGSLYHHHRALRWERDNRAELAIAPTGEPEEQTEPGSFEELVEREERAMAAREHVSSEIHAHSVPGV